MNPPEMSLGVVCTKLVHMSNTKCTNKMFEDTDGLAYLGAMVKTLKTIFFCICAYSCGDDSALECKKSDRHGAYLVHYDELAGGTCGPVPDEIVVLGDGFTPSSDCTLDHEKWSEGDCQLERALLCDFTADDLHASMVVVTEQKDSDGDRLVGTMTARMNWISSGSFACSGSYKITATRQ